MAVGWDDAVMAGFQLWSILRNNGGGDAAPSNEERELQQEAIKMLQMQKKRTNLQNPLYEAVTRMAMGLLPTSQQREIPPMYWDLPTAGGPTGGGPPPTNNTGGGNPNGTGGGDPSGTQSGFTDPAAGTLTPTPRDPNGPQFANGAVYDEILRQNRRLMGR